MECTNLEYMCENDRRALADFVSCTSCCGDCRAKPYCDRFSAFDGEVTEAEWLMAEMGNEVDSISSMRKAREQQPIEKEIRYDRA